MAKEGRDNLGQFINGHRCLKTKTHDYCLIKNCNRKHHSNGLCVTHYVRLKHGKNKSMIIPIGAIKSQLGYLYPKTSPSLRPSLYDIYWAAGICEGEGAFAKYGIRVCQKERWVLDKLKKLFGGSVRPFKNRHGEYHIWTLYGTRGRGLMLTIFPILSPVRKEKILSFKEFFKNA